MTQPGILLGRDDRGDRVSLPVGGVVAGQSVVAGAPDSGRRETTQRLLAALLEGGHRLLLVDTIGDFASLGDRERVLAVGPQPASAQRVAPDDASRLVNLALRDAVPVVVDLSREHDPAVARELLTRTLRRLRDRARSAETSLLVAVSGIERYLPANERLGDPGRLLATIASDGPAHGLGVLGTTRRPADLKRDVLTEADWMLWHRLDRSDDIEATRRILGREYGRTIADFEAGQAVVQCQWADRSGRRITVDGAPDEPASTPPGLGAYHRPDPAAVRDSPLEFAAGSAADTSIAATDGSAIQAPPEPPASSTSGSPEGAAPLPAEGDHGTAREGTGRGVNDSVVDRKMARLRRKGEQLGADTDGTGGVDPDRADLVRLLQEPPVVDSIDGAAAESVCTRDQAWAIVGAVLAHGPVKLAAFAASVSATTEEIASFLNALESRSLVRHTQGRYSLQETTLRRLGADARADPTDPAAPGSDV